MEDPETARGTLTALAEERTAVEQRLEALWERTRRAIREADDAGLNRREIAALARVSPQTVYKALGRPEQ
ncbi:helix-turn-helix domain-containing protein [Actinopolyspora mortivallis]|uniref:helix-turn-helix domain-containing protein n=1 Tax=Actinopolyspora mortivallis TaxID=33906 RepID=UPI000366EA9E|nr:helix-turn-helix domain-containing protein [Actinopolyspora mortivallis]